MSRRVLTRVASLASITMVAILTLQGAAIATTTETTRYDVASGIAVDDGSVTWSSTVCGDPTHAPFVPLARPEPFITDPINDAQHTAHVAACDAFEAVYGERAFRQGIRGTLEPTFGETALLSALDDHFDSTFMVVTVETEDETHRSWGCGIVSIELPDGPTERVAEDIHAVFLDTGSMETCFGSQGDLIVTIR